MTVVAGVDALRAEHGPSFVVVGVFDGIHLGHQYLLRHLRQAASHADARPAVITFDHHPDEILIGAAPPLLCDPEERLQRLAAAGVAVTVVQHFDEALRMTSYDAFVERLLDRIGLRGFLMTPDAAFGHERRGTPAALAVLGAERGFEVDVVKPFVLDGRPVRSTDVRAAIAAGDLSTAARLLGRPVAVVGAATAATGATYGSTVTFALPVALPPPGDYDVRVSPTGRRAVHDRATVSAGTVHLTGSYSGPVRVVFTRPGVSAFAG